MAVDPLISLSSIPEYFESKSTVFDSEVSTTTFLSQSECKDHMWTLLGKPLSPYLKTEDERYYFQLYFDQWFQSELTRWTYKRSRSKSIHDTMIQLKQLVLPEQRSPEWYQIRENLLTASSLADALGKGHFQTRDDLLISKTSDTKATVSKASRDIMEWGVKYEPVATRFYEHMNDLTVVEFGLIPHPELSVFGASPDGICDIGSPNGYEGRMLEIKCPPRRQFTAEVPKHYWMQMQGQLEVCDLDECDFLQVKLEQYDTVNEYEQDCLVSEYGIQHGLTGDGLPKGLLVGYHAIGSLDIMYAYSPWLGSLDSVLNWLNHFKTTLGSDYVVSEQSWWKITRYECTLVHRDKQWWLSVVPDIIQFWSEVVHYRNVGNEEVQKRINGRKRGPRKKTMTIQAPLKGYLLDD